MKILFVLVIIFTFLVVTPVAMAADACKRSSDSRHISLYYGNKDDNIDAYAIATLRIFSYKCAHYYTPRGARIYFMPNHLLTRTLDCDKAENFKVRFNVGPISNFNPKPRNMPCHPEGMSRWINFPDRNWSWGSGDNCAGSSVRVYKRFRRDPIWHIKPVCIRR